jgi:uncharacterized protein (UPF0276 family)
LFQRPPRLGVGLAYQGSVRSFVKEHLEEFDYLEVIPDIFWSETLAEDGTSRFEDNLEQMRVLDQVAEHRPLVSHSVGLSIGSAERFDTHYVEQLARWNQRYRFPWMSEHLAFTRLPLPTGEHLDLGVMAPVPYDVDILELLVQRITAVQAAVRAPFLLENNVYYYQLPEQDLSEAEFLNQLMRRTDCGLLLDLHNVYTNARNHGFEPRDFLATLDLSRVVELHVAGGLEWDGIYMDAHSGVCPEPVWELLEELLPRLPNLGGVVFELFGNYFPSMGAEALVGQLRRIRAALERHGKRP